VKFELADRTALFPVDKDGGDLFRMLVEFLAPLPQGNQDREYAAPLRRQQIFLIRAAVGGGRGLQDALIDQPAKPHREDVLGESQLLLEFAEAGDPKQRLAKDQQRPPVADSVQRARDRAVVMFKAGSFHLGILSQNFWTDHGLV
jgi:hypothetical protein